MGTDMWRVRCEPAGIDRDYDFFNWLMSLFSDGPADRVYIELKDLREKLKKETPAFRKKHRIEIGQLIKDLKKAEWNSEQYEFG